MTNLGKKLEELEISIREFSKLSGIPYSTLRRYISGERLPDWKHAVTIRRVLGCRSDEFLRLFDDRQVSDKVSGGSKRDQSDG